MGRVPLQPSCAAGQGGRAGTEPAPGGLGGDAEGSDSTGEALRGCRGVAQGAGGSGRGQGLSDRGLGGLPQFQSSLKFVA